MNNFNSLLIEGYVVKEPEKYKTDAGFDNCKLTLGVDRFYSNRNNERVRETSYFDVEAWGNRKETEAIKEAHPGDTLRVVGRLKQNTWKDKDGKSHSSVSVVAEYAEFRKRVNTKSKSAEKKVEQEVGR